MSEQEFEAGEAIAIVGMAGRFPGAQDVDAFWRNLRDGVESIRAFTDEELAAAGVTTEARAHPDFVNSGSLADDLDCFDAAFFGIGRREAEIMDPQHRIFLETAWEALERAGYDPDRFDGLIGVFGGIAPNTYRNAILNTRPDLLETLGDYLTMICCEREYAVTRTAFKLNLRGASMTINTACSTSGVALHLACQSLLSGENDMCLVGGGRVRAPLTAGYTYLEDGIPSPDGHCRAFDSEARGTAIGNGMAMIVVKRLSDAIRDRDHIHAVVKATAVNNDGAEKVGFTAPSVRGQSAVIAEALAIAGVSADTIGYLEAHGTGTALGDPIEVAAATQAFRETTDRRGYCGIGSVKTNIGHLDTGAGLAGIIKAALALEHAEIPPSLNYTSPNPQIDFERSPFFVVDALRDWETNPDFTDTPRRAGISCFGLGGTNAHIVLEESPAEPLRTDDPRRHQLWIWSARTEDGLERATERLHNHVASRPDLRVDDVTRTLQVGRRRFEERRILVAEGRDDALAALENRDPRRLITQHAGADERPPVFMFPGGGAQYVEMGRGLYETEAVFRDAIDRCLRFVELESGMDLSNTLYPQDGNKLAKEVDSERPTVALPLLFSVEYALTELWMSWGLKPVALIGHSMGEYAAACASGVVSLEDALRIVMVRGELFEKVNPGTMLGVQLGEAEAREVAGNLCIAAVNRPGSCVISGPIDEVETLQRRLEGNNVECSRIHISVAAHSRLLDPVLDEFRDFLSGIHFREPEIPYVSNVTGDWITDSEAMDPDYWVKHLRQTVRFSDGLQRILCDGEALLIEVGPGQTLSAFARQHPQKDERHIVLSSMRHPRESTQDDAYLLGSLGKAWLAGASIDWDAYGSAHSSARRVPLPAYPFERIRTWVEPALQAASQPDLASAPLLSPAKFSEAPILALQSEPPNMPIPATVPTRSRKERICDELIEVVIDLSGLDENQIDVHATFIELGFDSLLLTQANTAFKRRFAVRITFRQLFEEAPTLDSLAAYIDTELPKDAFPAPPSPISPSVISTEMAPGGEIGQAISSMPAFTASGHSTAERIITAQMNVMRQQLALLRGESGIFAGAVPQMSAPPESSSTALAEKSSHAERHDNPHRFPLTESQLEIWLAASLNKDASHAFHISAGVHLRGPLDEDILDSSLRKLILRHEALRIRFEPNGEFQNVSKTLDVPLRKHDLSNLDAVAQNAKIEALRIEDSTDPFDLVGGPLIRFTLIKLDDTNHRIVISAHHIICDGWSMGLLFFDLGALYAAGVSGDEPAIPAEPVQFGDFARREAAALSGPAVEESEAYWLGLFEGELPVLELPTDRPRPPTKTYAGGQAAVDLDARALEKLKSYASENGVTVFSSIVASYALLLKRLTNDDDVVIGVATAGQPATSCQDLVGHCVNLYPLRSRVARTEPFPLHVKEIQGALLDSLDYRNYTFGSLIRKLEIERDPGRLPLMSTLVTYETETEGLSFGALNVEIENTPKRFCNFDLELYLTETSNGLHIEFHHNLDLFDSSTVERWLDNLQSLLNAAVDASDLSALDLPMIGEAETQHLLRNATGNCLDYDIQQTVPGAFEAQVGRTPDAIAVRAGNIQLSYEELNQRANQLARHLQSLGIERESLVGVCMERSEQLLVAVLGILKAGAAYVPLDPNYPRDRVDFMLDDSAAQVVVTEECQVEMLTHEGRSLVCLDRDAALLRDLDSSDLGVDIPSDQLSYVIYTSGSTGKPKGVAIEHRSVIALICWAHTVFSESELMGVLASTSICFDLSAFEMFVPLARGGSVIVVENALALSRMSGDEGVTLVNSVPSILAEVLHAGTLPPSVKTVNLAGEPLTAALVDKIYEIDSVERVYDLYGPSEDTTYSTWTLREAKSVTNIGRPIANTQAYILDEHQHLAALGAPGELFLGGDGLARGYFNQPELTQDRFIPNPLGGEPSPRLYRTGDLARYLPDGRLEYLGRIDQQIKLRGFRIELGEIESVLEALPGINRAAVAVHGDGGAEKQLVAYTCGPRELPALELRESLRARLPDYMVPSSFVRLPELPLTPNGKIDRKALPTPTEDLDRVEPTYAPPTSKTETELAELWGEILGVKSIGLQSNFFDLGGHSLLAFRLAARIDEAFGVDITLRDIFETPNLFEQASAIEQALGQSAIGTGDLSSDEEELVL